MDNISKTRLEIVRLALKDVVSTLKKQDCFGTSEPSSTQCVNYAKRSDGVEVRCAVGALMPADLLQTIGITTAAGDLSDGDLGTIYGALYNRVTGDFTYTNADSSASFDRLATETREGFRRFLMSMQNLHDCGAHRLEGESGDLDFLALRHKKTVYAFERVRLMFDDFRNQYGCLTSETTENFAMGLHRSLVLAVGETTSASVPKTVREGCAFITVR